MATIVQVNKRGCLTLPAEVRRHFNLQADAILMVEKTPEGILLRPAQAVPLVQFDEPAREGNGTKIRPSSGSKSLSKSLSKQHQTRCSSASRPDFDSDPDFDEDPNLSLILAPLIPPLPYNFSPSPPFSFDIKITGVSTEFRDSYIGPPVEKPREFAIDWL